MTISCPASIHVFVPANEPYNVVQSDEYSGESTNVMSVSNGSTEYFEYALTTHVFEEFAKNYN